MTAIKKEVLSFLKKIKKNNNREWFEVNKPEFKRIETEVKHFGQQLKESLEATEHIDGVKLFRVYRDVRFSKDKTPYKTHFGISMHREKPRHRGGYFVQLKPNENFAAVGFGIQIKKTFCVFVRNWSWTPVN